jgi:hypothetical protein
VTSASGFGEHSEEQARTKQLAWAKDQGKYLQEQRFFGYNNPNPAPGSPKYSYEQWVSVGPEAKSAEGIEIKEFLDGLSLQRVAADSSCRPVRGSAATAA